MREPEKFYVETLDMKNPNWKEFDFSKFDVVFHVAGIAHVSPRKSYKDLYFSINRDLAIEVAQKSKSSCVKQFIFMSSMIIFGDSYINADGCVDTSITSPKNFYGQSKLEADTIISQLECNEFKVAVIRAPVVFGLFSKGNFRKLVKISRLLFVFPDIKNKKSMLYINNLCVFLRYLIIGQYSGVYYPQNREYFSLYSIVKMSRESFGLKFRTSVFLSKIVRFLMMLGLFKNIFGDKCYDLKLLSSIECASDFLDNETCLRESVI